MTDSYYPRGAPPYTHDLASSGGWATLLSPSAQVGIRPCKNYLGVWTFWLLAIVLLSNLNAVVWMATGLREAFSVVILVLCLIILACFRFTIWRDLGTPGRLLVGTVLLYLLISSRFGVSLFAVGDVDGWIMMRIYLSALLIIVAAAVAARHLVVAWPIRKTFRLLYLVCLLGTASIFLGMVWPGLYTHFDLHSDLEAEGRQVGFFENPNEAGLAVCIAAAAGFAFLVLDKRKVLSIAGILLCLPAVLLTFSRTAILVFMLVTGTQLFISKLVKNKAALVAILAVAAGMTWFFVGAIGSGTELGVAQHQRVTAMVDILKGDLSDRTTGSRFRVMAAGLHHCLQRPLDGNGLGFMNRMPGVGQGPHNTFLFMWGDGGILPMLLLVVSLVVFGREAWKCPIPAIRVLVLSFLVVFFATCMTSHGALLQRNVDLLLGVGFDCLVGARELSRRGIEHRK